MYHLFTRISGESYRRRLRSLLVCLCYDDVPLVEFMYLVFTRMPGESYRRSLLKNKTMFELKLLRRPETLYTTGTDNSLRQSSGTVKVEVDVLCLCYIIRALINSLAC